MEKMLAVPKSPVRLGPTRLCLIMGLTILLFIAIAHHFGDEANVLIKTQQS